MSNILTEANITKGILKYLRSLENCFAWKAHGGMYGTDGVPDIIACLNGRFFAFEVKRPGNKPTKIQEAVMGRMKRAGGRVHVVYSVRDVKRIIRGEVA